MLALLPFTCAVFSSQQALAEPVRGLYHRCKHGKGIGAICSAHHTFVRLWPLAVTGKALDRPAQHLQDQYLEVNSPIPASATLFGAGEHISATGLPLRRDGVPLTLWTRDCAAADPDQNTYGSWPFLIDVRQGGLSPGKLEPVDIRLHCWG